MGKIEFTYLSKIFPKFIIIVYYKDGRVTNINNIDEDMKNATVPEDVLDSIYVGRCVGDKRYCSSHLGSFTDLNIWNRALTVDEMISWTNCR